MKKIILSLALLISSITPAHAYLVINPASMEFGSVKIGTVSSQMFTIINIGNEDVQITSCMVFGVFQCQLQCFGTIHGGGACSGLIYFRPLAQRYEIQSAIIGTSKGSLSLSVHGFGKL